MEQNTAIFGLLRQKNLDFNFPALLSSRVGLFLYTFTGCIKKGDPNLACHFA